MKEPKSQIRFHFASGTPFSPSQACAQGKSPADFLLSPFPLFLEKGFPTAAPGALVHRAAHSHGSPFAPGEPDGKPPVSPGGRQALRVFRPLGFWCGKWRTGNGEREMWNGLINEGMKE